MYIIENALVYMTRYFIKVTLKRSWHILRRHEDDQGHVEIVRNSGEAGRVVGVDNKEGWTSGEGKQISRIQATMLFHVSGGTGLSHDRFYILAWLQENTTKVVACVLWLRADWKGTVGG